MDMNLNFVRSDCIKKYESWIFWFLFFFIFVFSFVVRVYYAKKGLPYIHNWDEPHTASTALQMLKTGDLNPHFFNYGTLTIYINYVVDVFHYLYLMGKPEGADSYLTRIDDIKINKDTGWQWEISHPSFYYWNRIVTVMFGVGTVLFTYILSSSVLGNKWLGLISAAFVGALAIHIEHSAYITPDVPVAFFVVAATYYSLQFLDHEKTSYLAASLALCGLAIATKYNSALVVLFPVALVVYKCFMNEGAVKWWWLAMLPVVPLVVFLLAMPYALLDIGAFLKAIGYEVRHYKVLGHAGNTSQPGMEHAYFQFRQFFNNLGLLNSLVAVIGVAAVILKRKLVLVFVVPVIYFLYMTNSMVNFHRNFIQIYPFISILVASSIVVVNAALGWFFGARKNMIRVGLSLAFPAIIVIGVAYMSLISFDTAVDAKVSRETRSRVIDAINAENEIEHIYIAKELRIHQYDLKRLSKQYSVVSVLEIAPCEMRAGSVLVLPTNPKAFNKASNRGLEVIRANENILSLLRKDDVFERIEEMRSLYLDVRSVDPGVLIAKPSCSGIVDLAT